MTVPIDQILTGQLHEEINQLAVQPPLTQVNTQQDAINRVNQLTSIVARLGSNQFGQLGAGGVLEVTINNIVARIGTLEQLRVGDCLNDMQAAIHSIGGTVQGLGTAISQGRAIDRGIMECKAVINLIKISSDKSQFRMWDDKLINAYIQYAGPKVRQVFKLLAETADEGKLDEPTLESWSRVAAGEPKLEKEKFREDLYLSLIHISEPTRPY